MLVNPYSRRYQGKLKLVLGAILLFMLAACGSQPDSNLVVSSSHTLEVRIATSADDAEERSSGSVNRNSHDLEMTHHDDGLQTVGLRFDKLSVPPGAKIRSAYLQFQSSEASSEATSLTLHTEATDSAAPFSGKQKNISARALSRKAVLWSPPAWTNVGQAAAEQRTPELASLIQETIDRPGWQSGNALAVVLTGTGKRVAKSFDGDALGAPMLYVVYDVASAGTQKNHAPTVTAGPDQSTGLSVALTGKVEDDGLPSGNVTVHWSRVSGPGPVTFNDNTAASTTASFATTGSYVLRLSASDGKLSASDDLTLSVQNDGAKAPAPSGEVSLPARAAFYYPWYPQTWSVNNKHVFYHPTLGYYDSSAQTVVDEHIASLEYAKVDVGIASWWGQNQQQETERIPLLLGRTESLGSSLKWALYYEKEGFGNPSSTELASDLAYIKANYTSSPAYAFVNGKPVLFVYNSDDRSCGVADKWKAATKGEWYIVLKVLPNYKSCTSQPDSWHQYAPSKAADHQNGYAYAVAPGFWRADEAQARLARDLNRFRQNVRDMVSSHEPWQLVTTFNEWGEGTAVEAASEWGSGYLDALHTDGQATNPTPEPSPEPTPNPSPSSSVTLVAAGDIACDPASGSFNGGNGTSSSCKQKATSDLIAAAHPDAVLTLGDNQYDAGVFDKFMTSYDLSWGKFKALTYPAIGNHEGQQTGSGRGYCQYFGSAAHCNASGSQDGAAYYSYNLGAWHVVALNSNCTVAGGCGVSSAQYKWLVADLAANPTKCTLAYWHHPRFSSGEHGNNSSMSALWQALYDARAEVVLSGHDHDYERFAPQDASGHADTRGLRQFVVGTGGKTHYGVNRPIANSEVNNDTTYGVLELTLNANSYDWRFAPEPGKSFSDAGSADCH